jgi:hypothetical protein
MSRIITFKGKLPMGLQERLHLSTNDGLTGYRIKKFQMITNTPGVGNSEFIGQIFLTDQTGSIGTSVDFSDADLLAVCFRKSVDNSGLAADSEQVIFDKETFNQDIFINITDGAGNTVECNYYIELEQFKLDLNSSTYHTLKNIRSATQV